MRALNLAAVPIACLALACGGTPGLLIDTAYVDEANVAIPSSGSVQRSITVVGEGPVAQGTVEVVLQHSSPTDLTVSVRTPGGVDVALGGRIAEGDDFYRFAVPLLAAQGMPADGAWRLDIVNAGPTPGTLVVWGVDPGG